MGNAGLRIHCLDPSGNNSLSVGKYKLYRVLQFPKGPNGPVVKRSNGRTVEWIRLPDSLQDTYWYGEKVCVGVKVILLYFQSRVIAHVHGGPSRLHQKPHRSICVCTSAEKAGGNISVIYRILLLSDITM